MLDNAVQILRNELVRPAREMIESFERARRGENQRHELVLAAIQLLPYHLEKTRGTHPKEEDCRRDAYRNAIRDAEHFLHQMER